MKIYTRKGDQGKTRLLGGLQVSKNDPRVKTYGAVDELQAHLGMARAIVENKHVGGIVMRLQKNLLTASAQLAATPAAAHKLKQRITAADVTWLEERIDALTEVHGLPQRFILPGRDAASAAMHVARAVCRRCERLILSLSEQTDKGYPDLAVYFNRLSDLLFTLAWALEMRALIKDILVDLMAGKVKGDAPCS